MKKILTIDCLFIIVWITLFYTNNLKIIDDYIYNLIIINDKLTPIFKIITSLSNTMPICLIVITILIILLKKDYKNETIQLGSMFVTSGLTMVILKNIFRRPRPNINRLIKIGGFSFPSGHSLMSFILYGYLIILIKKNYKGKYKTPIITLLSLTILLIGFSRIYLGVHYFSDVMFGYSLGLLILTVNELINSYKTKK